MSSVHEIEQKAKELADNILNSEEYKKYKEAKDALYNNEPLLREINEFRKQNFIIQNRDASDIRSGIDYLVRKYEEMFSNNVAAEFFEWEQRLCRLMQRVNGILVEDIDLELDFLE